MIKYVTTILIFIPLLSFCQYTPGYQAEFFFGRQPSARVEAMGKGSVSLDGDMGTIYYNPAGLSNINGLEINGTYATPFYLADSAYYAYTGVGYRFNKYIQVALSRYHWNWNMAAMITGFERTPSTSNYTLTLASEPFSNLFLGVNANYYVWDVGIGDPATTFYLDFGAIKKFNFLQRKTTQHESNIGASIANLNYAKATFSYLDSEFTEALPVTARFGASYQFTLDKHILLDTLKTLKLLIQSEYQTLLNSDYHSAIKVGGELSILEILAIRVGYYQEQVYDYSYPEVNHDQISDFTYGFGLQIPLDKLTKIPLSIKFDYTSLPQTPYSTSFTEEELGKFSSYTVRLNWQIKKMNSNNKLEAQL
ncbi:MAG: hypothetical protein JKY54_01270 [Flavobacteriales bacterium]|nr:hypothetical protein [Flavobacteriales bacterium]